MKITQQQIEHLAAEIIDYCKRHHFSDMIVYYNGKRIFIDYDGITKTEPADVHDYLEYAGDILSISFEGAMYDIFNYSFGERSVRYINEFDNIIGKFGLYFEQGHAWNLSLFEV